MHVHPVFAIVGIVSCYAVMVWLLPAIPYAISRRKTTSAMDMAMVAGGLLVAAAIVVPDNFFA